MVIRIEKKPQKELTPIKNSTLNPFTEPVARVKPGEIIEISTWDAYGGIISPTRTFQEAVNQGLAGALNPVTGPIYIKGSEPGDTLLVEIISIELPEWGGTSIIPGFGALEGWLNLMDPMTKISYIRDGKIIYNTDNGKIVEIDANPFIGTIGVSPAYEAIQTLAPGPHGGNMDCPDICPGNVLYLPVTQEGALFGLGDVHAVQGDGEICGTAVEIGALVRLKFDILKKTILWPRIESNDTIMTVCSARPLEDATRIAYRELINWMVTDFGWKRDDAYMFLSLAGKTRIAQIVDPLFTVVAKVPKKLINI
jgi:acetamidase/formamidase